MRIILLNAPARAGKSTAAKMLAAGRPGRAVIGFSYHLKRMVHGIYFGKAGWEMDPDVFDGCKSEPQDVLDGMSWRQAYIHYSENVIKPLHGKEWFGAQFVRAAKESGADLIAVPDSGFVQEAERTVREFGRDNVRLIRIYREGKTFEGDSRSYISLKHAGVAENEIHNIEGHPEVMRDQMERLIQVFA